MSGPRLRALRKQFDDIKSSIETINRAASDAGRDLTDDESADLDKLFDRAEQLKPEIEKEASRENSIVEVAEVISRVGGSNVDRSSSQQRSNTPPELSASEYLAEYFRAFDPDGGGSVEQFLDRAARYVDRAEQTTADTTGILPEPIIGALIKFADSTRPVFNSFTSRPMPRAGKKFTRPRVTQRVNVAQQSAELAELVSRKMIIVPDEVSKLTFAGTLDISEQDVDWTDPASLEIVLSDFTEFYAEATEGEAADVIEGLAETYSPYVATNVATLVESYVDGVLEVYDQCKRMPDTIWTDLASWATLASTTNTNNDRTALSMIRESLNELGAGPMRWIVGPQLAADTRVVGASNLVESYEQRKGLLRAVKPSVLGHEIAYFGYVAFYGRPEGFVNLGTDPQA